jgi:hypothetical protein
MATANSGTITPTTSAATATVAAPARLDLEGPEAMLKGVDGLVLVGEADPVGADWDAGGGADPPVVGGDPPPIGKLHVAPCQPWSH